MKRWFDEIGQTFIAPQNKLPTLSTGLRRFVSFSDFTHHIDAQIKAALGDGLV
jgi:hypothetical protein